LISYRQKPREPANPSPVLVSQSRTVERLRTFQENGAGRRGIGIQHENVRFLIGKSAGTQEEARVQQAISMVFGLLILPIAAVANQTAETQSFSILRNGEPIGTNTISVRSDGPNTLVGISTSILLKIGFLTLYRFDQTERERWADGRFVSMTSTTDDDGTMHHVHADASRNALWVTADGKTKRMPAGLLPSSLWNAAMARQTSALSTVDGSLIRITVADGGAQDISLWGRQIDAHHYSLHGIYSQDVWYDRQGDLVRMQLRGSDGSTILYQPASPARD
jgi:uncharacterized protein DUF6134